MVGKILAASYSEKNVARFALDRGKSPPPICVEFLSMPCYCRRREEESKMSDKFFLGGGNPSTPSLPHCIWLWLDSPRPAPHSSLTHSTVKRRSSCCSCSLRIARRTATAVVFSRDWKEVSLGSTEEETLCSVAVRFDEKQFPPI